jgi:hypothetical protein
MAELSRAYIDQHLPGVQTYESFGRTIVDMALRAGIDQLGDREAPEADVASRVSLRPVDLPLRGEITVSGCIQVCVTIDGWTVCIGVHN